MAYLKTDFDFVLKTHWQTKIIYYYANFQHVKQFIKMYNVVY